jgi:hypothetical protein
MQDVASQDLFGSLLVIAHVPQQGGPPNATTVRESGYQITHDKICLQIAAAAERVDTSVAGGQFRSLSMAVRKCSINQQQGGFHTTTGAAVNGYDHPCAKVAIHNSEVETCKGSL